MRASGAGGMASPGPMSDSVPVELVTIFVKKKRFKRVGIELVGGSDGWPRVHSIRGLEDSQFRVDDIVYMINGREANGCAAVARTIWRKRCMSITLMRRVHAPFVMVWPSVSSDHSSLVVVSDAPSVLA